MSKLTMEFYFNTLGRLLKEPKNFFSELPENMDIKLPLSFLFISCLISTGTFLILQRPASFLLTGSIYFVNAFGMVFIAALFTFIITAMFIKNRITYRRCLTIYAFSTGITVLAAGIPFFLSLTEPWKWWLIGTGMVHSFKIKTIHVVLLLTSTIIIIILFFWSALPVINYIKLSMI